jgi:tetratricopeptide (TPR) repeat protein
MTTMQDVSFQPAIDEFQKVIDAYQNEKDEVLKELSAEAYANLGEIYSLTGELDLAAQDYRQAILLNHDPQRQQEFQKELTAVEEEIKASK